MRYYFFTKIYSDDQRKSYDKSVLDRRVFELINKRIKYPNDYPEEKLLPDSLLHMTDEVRTALEKQALESTDPV